MNAFVRVVLMAILAAAQFQGIASAADPYPTRSVRILVGYSPGTTSVVFGADLLEVPVKGPEAARLL